MPDYDFSDGKCKVTITGKILNEDFARILIKNPDLDLQDILLLDKVQKQKPIEADELKYLRKNRFIEGRKGNIFLALNVIEPTHNKELLAEYINNKSFDDLYFKDLILGFIKKSTKVRRKDIDRLISPKLSLALSEVKKKNKITNFLSSLRIDGKIRSLPGYFWEAI